MHDYTYDLIVLGSGPAGEKAAVKAAYFGYKVALVEKESKAGGAGVNTGTLPSKTLKETALFFSAKYVKGLYGLNRELEHPASAKEFLYRKNVVCSMQAAAVESNINLHKVTFLKGVGSFDDPHTIRIKGSSEERTITGKFIIIATGSYPYHPADIPFDGKRVLDSDTILEITDFPKSLCIVGAGVIGCEYATIFSTMGTKVYLVNNSGVILSFLDKAISNELVEQMKRDKIEILFNTAIQTMTVPKEREKTIEISLKNGKVLNVDMFLYAAGRNGGTNFLKCENAGIKVGKRELLEVDSQYRTSVSHIFAVGDVIGFPALASTSMDQGRVAVAHMFDKRSSRRPGDLDQLGKVIPYGVYTVPEVSCVGKSEEDAKKEGLTYCIGIARYRDMPRGQIMGATEGFLKLVFTSEDFVIRGVHIIGPLATELIHYGVTLIENEKTLGQVIAAVFNFPTLHDLYKYACYDGLGNASGHKVKD